jgi:hypothetical protein
MLGLTISSDLTWNKHIDNIVAKAAKRVYMLYHLKCAGVQQHDLLNIYLSVIRPMLEYACPVWHTCLPQYLSDKIEAIQKRALRLIYPGDSITTILAEKNIPTLHNRRTDICKDYFEKMKDPKHKIHHLIPKSRNNPYSLRSQNKLPLPVCRTNRYKNSLIPWCLFNQ